MDSLPACALAMHRHKTTSADAADAPMVLLSACRAGWWAAQKRRRFPAAACDDCAWCGRNHFCMRSLVITPEIPSLSGIVDD